MADNDDSRKGGVVLGGSLWWRGGVERWRIGRVWCWYGIRVGVGSVYVYVYVLSAVVDRRRWESVW